jgi:hypothetical protein
MEADWEVEVGGGAPVIEALWPGYVNLLQSPERLGEITETVAFPALGDLLLALNGTGSPLWTAKCDVWEPDEIDLGGFSPDANTQPPCALACYVDLLPREGKVFAQWKQAEGFCRQWVDGVAALALPGCRADLIVRQAIAGEADGFGVTAYFSAAGADQAAATEALTAALSAFARTIPSAADLEMLVAKRLNE